MAVLTHTELETLWVLAGGTTFSADVAAAIAQAESGGDPSQINNTAYPNRPGYHAPAKGNLTEYSVGLWQINMLAHPSYSQATLLSQQGNASAAVAIAGGGSSFGAWSTYVSGAYKRFLTGTVSVTPQPGSVFVSNAATATASGHRGYADLRNSMARHLPTQLIRSRRVGAGTWQLLAHSRKVKG